MSIVPDSKEPESRLHIMSLAVAIVIMVVGAVHPGWLLKRDGQVDHLLVIILCCSMSAGFVRGLGFIPKTKIWRWLFSCWSCFIFLFVGLAMKYF